MAAQSSSAPLQAPPLTLQPVPPPPKPTLRREWLLLGLSLLLLLGVVLPPLVNLGRYQHRIAETMSRSLGRSVTMSAVTLRLLPAPALVLSDVVVNEDGNFGAEPALRAPMVVAQLRLASLWRGRLEVSRVELSDASVNLVRNSAGRWNVGSVLLQASHVPNAPTAQRRSGPAPRFPYIEITDSRVNVKQGTEKLPYSLLNANLSIWLAEPEVWQIRVDGQPVRTDLQLGLSDTGLVHVEGTLHRATALGQMPLALHADWTGAPLGQASRLLLGRDSGWRGDLHAAADVTGDLDSLGVTTHLVIANLHREEFTPAAPFSVDAICRGSYSRAAQAVSGIACHWPIDTGELLLEGNIVRGPGVASGTAAPAAGADARDAWQPDLQLTARQLPSGFLLAAAGLARSDFSPAFSLKGALDGTVSYVSKNGRRPQLAGTLQAAELQLAAAGLSAPLVLPQARLALTSAGNGRTSTLTLTSAAVDLGGAAPVQLHGQLTGEGMLLHASGSAALARLEDLGRAAHLLPTALDQLKPQGTAEFDLTRSTSWQVQPAGVDADDLVHPAGPGSVTSGFLRLHNAVYTPDFLPGGVELPGATATFSPGEVLWSAPAAIFHQMPVQLTAHYPLACAPSEPCVTRFRAAFGTLDAGALGSALLGDTAVEHPFDALLNRLFAHPEHWPTLGGTVHADTLMLGRLAAHHADATLSIGGAKVTIENLQAQALGGLLDGEGAVSISKGQPVYAVRFSLTRGNAAAAGNLFDEDWGVGVLNIASELRLAGARPSELLASASGRFHAEWMRGGLGIGTPLAQFARWSFDGNIGGKALTLTTGELSSGGGGQDATSSLPVTGRIGFDRTLALTVGGPGQPVTVLGTLAQPITDSVDQADSARQ